VAIYTRSLNLEAHTDLIELKAELKSSDFIPKDISFSFNLIVSEFSTNFILLIKVLHFSNKSFIKFDFLANFIFVIFSLISSFIFLFSSNDKKYSFTLKGIAKLSGYLSQLQLGTFPNKDFAFNDFAPTLFS
jgi:hypothetical protein